MFSTLRTRFGIPGVISVIALVFAMFGGAYAASKSSEGGKATASAKAKRGPRGPKGPAGPAGPQGPVGPQGAKGDKGDSGSNGSNGSNGANGKSVETGNATVGECANGGATVLVAGEPATKKKVCNGAPGTNGTNGTFSTEPLPEGETLTGAWGTSGGGDTNGANPEVLDISQLQVSFPISVSPEPTAVWPLTGLGAVGIALEDGDYCYFGVPDCEEPESLEELEAMEDAYAAACPGSAAQPEAASGFLCFYIGTISGFAIQPFAIPSLLEAANEYGLVVPLKVGQNSYARGSWAVTGG